MKRFRLYLNKISLTVFSLIICACATAYKSADFAIYHKHWAWVTQYPNETKKITTPEQFKMFYCKNGKQTRAVSKTIKAVIPSPPPGVPLEKAARRNKILYSKLKSYVASYFSWTEDEGHATRGGHYSVFTGLPFYSPDKIVSYFKTEETPDESDDELTQVVIVDFADKKQPSILGMRSIPTFSLILNTGQAFSSSGDSFVLRERPLASSIMVRPDEEHPFEVYKNDPDYNKYMKFDYGTSPAEGELQYYPMIPVAPFEGNYIRAVYTLLVPAEAQADVFGADVVSNIVENSGGRSKGIFVKANGSFNITAAVDSKALATLWELYFEKWTSVKESETDDPQIVMYQVSLDLNPYCAYGRPISDFLTK